MRTEKPQSLAELTDQIRSYVTHLREMGFRGVDCSEETVKRVNGWGMPPVGQAETLHAICADLKTCGQCELARSWPQPVAGAGVPGAALMFIGDWPEPEDRNSGVPFSGGAGELLTRMLKAMGFTRSSVYISHAVKCAPPAGNSPDMQAVRLCRRFLQREIAVVAPEIICTLGDVALKALLGEGAACESDRGRFYHYQGLPVMPTFSPAYLLAHPAAKRETWQDMKQVLARLNRQPPDKSG